MLESCECERGGGMAERVQVCGAVGASRRNGVLDVAPEVKGEENSARVWTRQQPGPGV